jgi:hypothetical protein
MRLLAFCEQGHDREKMYRDPVMQRFCCHTCNFQVTDEVVHRSIPKEYRFLFDSMFGILAASMLDIGGIDVIYDQPFMAKIEYPREEQV